MMLTAKIKNQAVTWSLLKRFRINDSVFDGINYYTNISGMNSVLTNAANWFKLTNNALNPGEIDKASTDIHAAGTDFVIDLSASIIPALPLLMAVYVDIAGDGHPLPLTPVNYNPVTKILGGMNSPTDFPSQIIKIFVL